MWGHFFDLNDGDIVTQISDNMGMDSNGNMMIKMGPNMAMDLDSGECHIISSWDNKNN